MQVVHIPVIALFNLLFLYFSRSFLITKLRRPAQNWKKVWPFALFGSLFNVWGLDVIQRVFEVDNFYDMMKVTVGCWLVFVLATNAKYFFIYNWSKKDFWIDYGLDLASFILTGILIFFAT